MALARPQTITELIAQAENYQFNTNVPLKYWTRAAETLYQEASFALSDGDYGRAYVMLWRHSNLVLHYLPKHPQFKDPENRRAFKPLRERVGRVLEELELLKPEIDKAYKEWERMNQSRPSSQRSSVLTAPSTYDDYAARDPSLSGNAKILDASENQDLAVDLARQEISRRDTARRATKQAGLSDDETSSRRMAGWWDTQDSRGSDTAQIDLQRQMETARRNLTPARDSDTRDNSYMRPVTSQHYNYPSISRSQPVDYDASAPPKPPYNPLVPPKHPPLPPRHEGYPSKPELPRKVQLDDYKPLLPDRPPLSDVQPSRPPKEPLNAPAPPKKERLTFRPGAYLENGDPIRSVFLPSQLRKAFLEIAADNTRAGLEMCGILCGTPVNNALFVRCLLIPDQKCTSDTCETINESAMFDYCIGEDLMMIGWIHTHPTQTCFMSSRDLHTHSGYQVMMPESIAIVCAPKFQPSYGIFRLTHPPGLNHILNCTHTDTFHQHSIGNLYREAEQPSGHVYESDKLPFYVHDLRGN
ncbi:hypothetical protein S40285_04687 [Stachybotrys chlorohalonatus IBT 40285]|uniref:MPN domain-containing protein n=1 Tax=Stachybotrys chlorohalonatus (strain IBT 40285) TaxID=1283841 RepID=A0A084R325_STAC4|nr:hypothetical protein S40285_04687 [Stachybotrys chlorohalonata IBT 40285]